jgi:uncharacterized membrane protein
MYYNSIGDYRPAGIIYLIAPFMAVLGRTVVATRLPSALVGAITIWPLYLLVVEVSGEKKGKKLGLIAASFWALSIWQIDVSSATSEAVVSTFLAIFGLYLAAKSINKKGWLNVVGSVGFFGLSYLFYHSARVTAPLLVLILAGYQYKKIKVKETIKQVVVVIIGVSLLSGAVMMQKEARERMGSMTRVLMMS